MMRKGIAQKRVVFISDLHCGHRSGLTPPEWQWPEKASGPERRKYAKVQRLLWDWYEAQIKALQPVYAVVVNGDAVDGKGYRSGGTEQITLDPDEQADMASTAIKCINPQKVYMTYGCLTAGHKILTADLRYVPVETLKAGDRLFSFTENPDPITLRRYWKEGKVLSNEPAEADVYKLTFSDGTTLEATYDHPFLLRKCGKYQWRTAEDLYRTGYHSDNKNTRSNGLSRTPTQYLPMNFKRFLPVWETSREREAGYLAGFTDGEGTLSQRRKPRRGEVEESHFTVQLYQNDGPVLRQVQGLLSQYGFMYRTYTYDRKKPNTKTIKILGGMPEVLRFLGQIRPERLLGKLNIDILGAIQSHRQDDVKLVSIRPAGRKTIYQLCTNTKTYIAEGFLCHNTPYHTGSDQDWENIVAKQVGAEKIADSLELDINGVLFHCRHAVSRSIIPHGRYTAPARELLWDKLWAADEERSPCDVLIRSHVHYFVFGGDTKQLFIITPALQAYSKYGVRQCSGEVHIGFVYFDIVSREEYSWDRRLFTLKKLKSPPLKA